MVMRAADLEPTTSRGLLFGTRRFEIRLFLAEPAHVVHLVIVVFEEFDDARGVILRLVERAENLVASHGNREHPAHR